MQPQNYASTSSSNIASAISSISQMNSTNFQFGNPNTQATRTNFNPHYETSYIGLATQGAFNSKAKSPTNASHREKLVQQPPIKESNIRINTPTNQNVQGLTGYQSEAFLRKKEVNAGPYLVDVNKPRYTPTNVGVKQPGKPIWPANEGYSSANTKSMNKLGINIGTRNIGINKYWINKNNKVRHKSICLFNTMSGARKIWFFLLWALLQFTIKQKIYMSVRIVVDLFYFAWEILYSKYIMITQN